MGKQLTTVEFIEKARGLHGDKYDYSNSVYQGRRKKIKIICPKHGVFEQYANNHLNGASCPLCARENSANKHRTTLANFIKKSQKVHGNKYDYSKVEYVNNKTEVCIICPIHGEFWQTPSHHLIGNGCSKCANEKKVKTLENFIEEANLIHNKYDYSKVEYIDSESKVCIICPEHGEFWQLPSNHLQGHGCPKCSGREKFTTEEFIEKAMVIHGDKYNYSKVNYVNYDTKVCIICSKHGEFWQTPHDHLSGTNCPKCNQSKLETKIENLFKENNITYKVQHLFDWLKYKNNLKLDFYLPEYNIAIECQGVQHFKPVDFCGKGKEYAKEQFKLNQERDKIKKQLCEEHGIKILYYSNLGTIEYPYKVFENKDELLKQILNEK